MKNIYAIYFLSFIGLPAYAQTSLTERVSAKATYDYNGSVYELASFSSYSWSAGRSSRQDGVKVVLENYDSMERGPSLDRTIKKYNADGTIAESVRKDWDRTTFAWLDFSRFTYQYLDKQLVRVTEEELRDSGLSKTRQTNYTFSGSKLVEKYQEVWNGTSWEDAGTTSYQYTAGKLIRETWGSQMKKYSYDASGTRNVVEYSTFKWGIWHPETKDSTIFSGGLPAAVIGFKNVAIMDPEWEKTYRVVYSYSSGMLSERTRSLWDKTSSDWVSETRFVNTYSGSNLTDSMFQVWDDSALIWQNKHRFVYTYNTNNHLSTQTWEEWRDKRWQTAIHYLEPPRTVYYYETVLGVPEAQFADFPVSLYPNPANGGVVYLDYYTMQNESGEIVLRDVSGRQVMRLSEQGSSGDHSVALPVLDLSPGHYFVTLYLGGQYKKTLRFVR
ncbi:MAG TPA: T9SS type A sorting domain-containing protein [Chitinophagaceae bacterium]|nr:T9SS type A sorting domain-containing protein [Chitinophagaceae bacterium]